MWTQGRRGAVLGASAAVVMCAGGLGLLAVESDGQDGGYVATGAAPGPSGAADTAGRRGVRAVPLGRGRSDTVGERHPADSASGAGPGRAPFVVTSTHGPRLAPGIRRSLQVTVHGAGFARATTRRPASAPSPGPSTTSGPSPRVAISTRTGATPRETR